MKRFKNVKSADLGDYYIYQKTSMLLSEGASLCCYLIHNTYPTNLTNNFNINNVMYCTVLSFHLTLGQACVSHEYFIIRIKEIPLIQLGSK